MPHTISQHNEGMPYPTFKELQQYLPPQDHPDYQSKHSWLSHILNNNLACFPDFFGLTTQAHLIDIRKEYELGQGIIPGANYYPLEYCSLDCNTNHNQQKQQDQLQQTNSNTNNQSNNIKTDDDNDDNDDEDPDTQLIARITKDFPKTCLISVVCQNGVNSRRISTKLRAAGFPFACVLAGGVRLFKSLLFSVNHDVTSFIAKRYRAVSIEKTHRMLLDDKALLNAAKAVFDERHKDNNNTTTTTQTVLHDTTISNVIITEEVLRHVANRDLQWIKLPAILGRAGIACIDGRGDRSIVGTAGGDFGLFITLLSVYESLMPGVVFNQAQVEVLFFRRLDNLGMFYLHTDTTHADLAMNAIKQHILPPDVIDMIDKEMVLLDIELLPQNYFKKWCSKIPQIYHESVLNLLTETSNYIGCGHLKLMHNNPDLYRVRQDLLKLALRVFFQTVFWSPSSGVDECDFVVLNGNHAECGVLSVELSKPINNFSKIPLIPPCLQSTTSRQMFVSHQQLMAYLRKQQCEWFLDIIDDINDTAIWQEQQNQQQQLQLEQQQHQNNNNNINSTIPSSSIYQRVVHIPLLSTNAKKAFQPMVEVLADIHSEHTVGRLAKDLPVFTLCFDVERATCQVELTTIVGASSTSSTKTTNTTTTAETNIVNNNNCTNHEQMTTISQTTIPTMGSGGVVGDHKQQQQQQNTIIPHHHHNDNISTTSTLSHHHSYNSNFVPHHPQHHHQNAVPPRKSYTQIVSTPQPSQQQHQQQNRYAQNNNLQHHNINNHHHQQQQRLAIHTALPSAPQTLRIGSSTAVNNCGHCNGCSSILDSGQQQNVNPLQSTTNTALSLNHNNNSQPNNNKDADITVMITPDLYTTTATNLHTPVTTATIIKGSGGISGAGGGVSDMDDLLHTFSLVHETYNNQIPSFYDSNNNNNNPDDKIQYDSSSSRPASSTIVDLAPSGNNNNINTINKNVNTKQLDQHAESKEDNDVPITTQQNIDI